ncbi:MAG: dihydroorotase, partial [Planctomyces sp.]
MKTLIRHAQVVLPESTERINVLIENGKVAALDVPDGASADEVIDASGLHLIPGVVDDQVHFREPGLTHKEDLLTATRACAKGGVTSFLEMPNTKPTTTSVSALESK